MKEKDKDKIHIENSSKAEYIKYYKRENEKLAVDALYNYFNTKKYMKQMQMS